MDSADGVMRQYSAGHTITTFGALDQEWILAANQTPVSQSYPTSGSCPYCQPMVLSVALTDKRGRRLALLQSLRSPSTVPSGTDIVREESPYPEGLF